MDYAVLADGSEHSERGTTAPGEPALSRRDVVFLTERLEHALQLDSYGELKPKNVRRAGSRNRAVAGVDVLLTPVATGVPVDVIDPRGNERLGVLTEEGAR